ncbi:DUF7793 family protein [Crocinitomix catalasitica]|uniref:DUF7793 family protein n=1 Tax=Crocinitomix catalasitica TaxID=184607 RepID=UPI0004856D4F|nr:hypothetical protein [Crocinitomix catalasitica]
MQKINCTKAVVKLKKSKIIYIDIQPNVVFEKDDFNELFDAVQLLGNGNRYYHIIKVGQHTLPHKDARELSSSKEGSVFKKADAFVVSTMAQKIMVDIMTKINRPVVPTKAFSTVKAAKIWINSLEVKEKQEMKSNNVLH